MKRFHVHVAVDDLAKNIRFYSTIFGAAPAVVKDDYAKWMLDDPRVNFAISQRGQKPGVNHLGLQVESEAELAAVHELLLHADGEIVTEEGVSCCYAKSDKHWITDPQGIAWETFRSLGDVPLYNGTAAVAENVSATPTVCCTPAARSLSSIAVAVKPGTGCCS